jgi:histone-lysine N-methyltransferase SETMAR
LDYPPYSPELAPSDFHFFLHLNKYLAGKKFDDDDELQEEVMTWFRWQAADFYDSGMQ